MEAGLVPIPSTLDPPPPCCPSSEETPRIPNVYFIIYLTEACNLECSYCESRDSRGGRRQEISYPFERLIEFLAADPDVNLQLYGGEPLLRIDLIDQLLTRVRSKHTCIQTNGLLLDQLPDRLLDAIDVLSVSLDGPETLTDAWRGQGVYGRVVEQVRSLRQRGYRGRVDARMTCTPGVSIFDAVTHFTDGEPGLFDAVYWQLNVLFGVEDWRFDRKFITRWLSGRYNQEITALVEHWIAALRRGQLLLIVPFLGLMHSLLTGERVECVRCGAGHHAWTVVPSGDVYPCPVLRASPDYCVGNIADLSPAAIEPLPNLRGPCAKCEVRDLCGGRCIYASESMRWGPKGFNLVCGTVKHLIRELEGGAPTAQRLMEEAGLSVGVLAEYSFDYEVIP